MRQSVPNLSLADRGWRSRPWRRNTGSSSPGELLMTFSTSAVAVCCCSASESRASRLHLVEQPDILDGDHGLIGKGLQQLDVMVVKRPGLRARDGDHADGGSVAQQRHDQAAAVAAQLREFQDGRVLRPIDFNIGDWKISPLRIFSPHATLESGCGNEARSAASASGVARVKAIRCSDAVDDAVNRGRSGRRPAGSIAPRWLRIPAARYRAN